MNFFRRLFGSDDSSNDSQFDFESLDSISDLISGGGSEPSYNAYDFGNIQQFINDANARDFLSGLGETAATEGSGVAGTGILTQGTNIPTSGGRINWTDLLKSIGGKAADYVSKNQGQVGLMAALAALGALSKAPPSGGGTTKRYVGPAQQLTRTITQGRYGPIAQYRQGPAIQYTTPDPGMPPDPGDPFGPDGRYAGLAGVPTNPAERGPAFANGELARFAERTRQEREAQNRNLTQYAAQGGIMHAYAEGGKTGRAYADGQPLTMEDGGFVMTGDAVRGARNVAGPQGIRALLPGAQMISAPGGPTDDRGKTAIVGKDGRLTPALVSNGEAYIPRRAQPPGGTRELYAMMRQLERRA